MHFENPLTVSEFFLSLYRLQLYMVMDKKLCLVRCVGCYSVSESSVIQVAKNCALAVA